MHDAKKQNGGAGWAIAGQIAAWLAILGSVVAWGLKVDQRDTRQHSLVQQDIARIMAENSALRARVEQLEETVKPGVLRVAASKISELDRRIGALESR